MTRSINDAGLNLIKEFEGLRLEPYRDQDGVWTIGYGSTRGITASTPPITEDEALQLLANDLVTAETEVSRIIRVSLNDSQYAALVSLVFNTGSAPLLKTLGLRLNAGDYADAAEEFLKWNHVNGVVSDGLTRRRNAERELFLTT